MSKRLILLGILVLSLLIPGLYLLHLESVFNSGATQEEVVNALAGYRLRVWLNWVIMVIVAVYYKWTTESNLFFKIIYLFMILAFGVEGIYIQRLINNFDVVTNFQDSYTYGILMSVINIIMVLAITAALHLGVWWFTRKWHRQ